MLAMLQSIPSMIESSESDGSESPPEPAANSVTKDETQLAILQLLREMQTDLKQSQSNNDRRFNPSSRKKLTCRKTPDDKTEPPRNDASKYCWTHGACNHEGGAYKFKAKGHRIEATFNNKLDGSCAYCN